MHEEAVNYATEALEKLLTRATRLSADEQTGIQKALKALNAYPEEFLSGTIEITVSRRVPEGGSSYTSISIGEEGLELSSGGSVYDPAVGSDSFSRTDFRHFREAEETEEEFGWEQSWLEGWRSNLPRRNDAAGEKAEVSVEDESEVLPTPAEEVAATFATYASALPDLLASLQDCEPATRLELSGRIAKETPGVYVFYDWYDQPQYVGRTRDLRRRLGEHGRDSSSHYSASFAFLRARKVAESDGHDLRGFSRKELANEHEAFRDFFAAAKMTVAEMTIRWVVVPDAVTQALLEVYAALELGTPFNSFETS
ncbi:GIY-YIG nuclease family protein [Hymenobacter terricola]|uniref:GIY-YIG nuclease family protein n=1 Tax=Hymenobacter terricola TaxID=2819236 RepID=UPI001B311470|nr:GIY-YIG nuclease family protein [Hymenobacter terricola]